MFVALFIMVSSALAESSLQQQDESRLNIIQFLKEEGFVPTIDDSDNSINFKKEGEVHWIITAGSNPVYIQFSRAGIKTKDLDLSILKDAVNEANKKVCCAKAMLYDGFVSLALGMYCHTAEEFRYVFYSCMDSLEKLENLVVTYYLEHSSPSE